MMEHTYLDKTHCSPLLPALGCLHTFLLDKAS